MFRRLSLVLVFGAFFGSARTEAEPAAKTSFARIVQANFSKWDLNHDGKLSVEETSRLVRDRAITGDEAAALAAIHAYQRNEEHNAPLSRQNLMQKTDDKDSGERRDKPDRVPRFESTFRAFRSHIAKAPRQLFIGNAPSLEGLKQGKLGDCYFLSVVGAAVSRNPAAVKRMFHPNPNGSCELTFPNGSCITVSRLTDAEIALGSTAGAQGLWLNVLEKGFGQVKLRNARKAHYIQVALDLISSGGSAKETIELLSGHRGEYLTFRSGKEKIRSPKAESRIPHLTAQLRKMFLDAKTTHKLLCCGTGRFDKLPPGIANNHDYAILSFDSTRNQVLVWNPWGNRYKPKGEPGLQNGYMVEGGKFSVPLDDFLRIFRGVFYETHQPPRFRGIRTSSFFSESTIPIALRN